MVPLEYSIETQLINGGTDYILTWSPKCVLSYAANQETTFAITDTKNYVAVVTLSTQDNSKLLQQFKSGFKTPSNWNKYQSKVLIVGPTQYLDYLSAPSFQGVDRPFVLRFKNIND